MHPWKLVNNPACDHQAWQTCHIEDHRQQVKVIHKENSAEDESNPMRNPVADEHEKPECLTEEHLLLQFGLFTQLHMRGCSFGERTPQGQRNLSSDGPWKLAFNLSVCEGDTDEAHGRGHIVHDIPGAFALPIASQKVTALWCTRLALKFTVHMGQDPHEHKPFATAAQCVMNSSCTALQQQKACAHMGLVPCEL